MGTKNYFIQEWNNDLFTYHRSHWFAFLSLWSLEQISQCAECCKRNEPFILLLPRAWYPWEEWQKQIRANRAKGKAKALQLWDNKKQAMNVIYWEIAFNSKFTRQVNALHWKLLHFKICFTIFSLHHLNMDFADAWKCSKGEGHISS